MVNISNDLEINIYLNLMLQRKPIGDSNSSFTREMTDLSARISSDDVSEAMLKATGSFFFSIYKEHNH